MTRMNPFWVRILFFPLHEALKGHPTRAALQEARCWDCMSAEEVAANQLIKLKRLLDHALRHVPYYQEAFRKAGVEVEAVESLTDLGRLPRLERSDLRKHRVTFIARDRKRTMAEMATGGSTGEPVTVFVDKRRAAVNTAARIRARGWWGVRVGDPEAVLWASPIEVGAQDRIRTLRDWFLNTRLFSAFEGSEAGLEALCQTLERYRPAVLYGYSSSLHLLARHVLATDRSSGVFGVKAVFATAEGLSPDQREDIIQAFGAGVGGEYGARDAGLITHECPAGGHHVLAEGMVVEVVKPDGSPAGPGERGEVVTTHLEAYGFPLIRYATGDVGIPAAGACPCGLALPRLESVEGRATDFLVAPDGRFLHALGAIYVLRVLPGIGAFQVEQPETDRLIVRIVREHGFPADGETTIREGLRKLMRSPVAIEILFVEDIPRAASGKHRYVISPVARALFRGDKGA